jgi:hypothetical protein
MALGEWNSDRSGHNCEPKIAESDSQFVARSQLAACSEFAKGSRLISNCGGGSEFQQQPYGFLDEARGSLRNPKMPNSVTATTATIHAVTVTV